MADYRASVAPTVIENIPHGWFTVHRPHSHCALSIKHSTLMSTRRSSWTFCCYQCVLSLDTCSTLWPKG